MKSHNKKLAYCFLMSNEARDFYLLLPIIYYLEKFEHYEVHLEFVWHAHKIRKKRPDLVILPNARGAKLYYEIAKYAKENEIPVFHHDSEGNFNTHAAYDYWAYNLGKQLFTPVLFTWNDRVKNFLETKYSSLKGQCITVGAPGFDKYKFLKYQQKKEVLKPFKLDHFEKVVGYAGWAFGKIYNKEIDDVLSVLKMGKEEGIRWMEHNRDIVEECLKAAIEKYPDVLFILKKHPRENFESDYRDSRNEMNRLKDYPNVLYIKDEIEIQDLIHISDLWMAFESTSIMEAWLMNTPTLLMNENENFNRVNIYKGALVAHTIEETLQAFHHLYSLKDLAYFNNESVLRHRKKIISESIGFDDGLNHLRSIKYFRPCLQQISASSGQKKQVKLNLTFLRLYFLINIGKLFYNHAVFKRLPKFKKTIWVFENRKLDLLRKKRKFIYPYMDEFYKDNQLDERIENGSLWTEL